MMEPPDMCEECGYPLDNPGGPYCLCDVALPYDVDPSDLIDGDIDPDDLRFGFHVETLVEEEEEWVDSRLEGDDPYLEGAPW